MDEATRDRAITAVRLFTANLATWLDPRFPHHALAIRGELDRDRVTTDRWNRIAAILASLHAIPGDSLTVAEHTVRNVALAAVMVAQKMAAAGLGCTRDPDRCIDLAAWRAAEIGEGMR